MDRRRQAVAGAIEATPSLQRRNGPFRPFAFAPHEAVAQEIFGEIDLAGDADRGGFADRLGRLALSIDGLRFLFSSFVPNFVATLPF